MYQIIKEYVFHIEGLKHSVKGRIVQEFRNGQPYLYSWDVSHYYRPEDGAEVYRPSNGAVLKADSERNLMRYISEFSNLDVTPNDLY